MISINEACEKALEIFHTDESNRIASIKDAGDRWLMSAFYEKTNYGGIILFVEKNDGRIIPFNETSVEDLRLFKQSPQVKIPDEYK